MFMILTIALMLVVPAVHLLAARRGARAALAVAVSSLGFVAVGVTVVLVDPARGWESPGAWLLATGALSTLSVPVGVLTAPHQIRDGTAPTEALRQTDH